MDNKYRFLTALLGVVLLLRVNALADDRRVDKSVLKVMTFNAEFLWDGQEPEEGSAEFDWKHSPQKAEEHMRRIAEVIIRHDPDVVNLVEVENLASLTRLNDLFLSGRSYKPYFVQGKDNATGQDVVLLSRIDPDGGRISRTDTLGQTVTDQGATVTSQCSKNYVARIVAGDQKIALIGLHFLAVPSDEGRRWKRQAQADVIRRLAVDMKRQGYSPVVLGDFNDYDGSSTAIDANNSTPISSVMRDIRAMDEADASDDLYNVSESLPKARRYTSYYRPSGVDTYTSIDHVLLAPELRSRILEVQISNEQRPPAVSDHYPIVVSLRTTTGVPTPVTPTPAPTPTPQPTPSPVAAGPVVVVALVPNPSGDETRNESISVLNISRTEVSLAGWKLRDRSPGQDTWSLDELDVLAPGEAKTIRRNGQRMALNNGGDTVELLDASQRVVHRVEYRNVGENEVVRVP